MAHELETWSDGSASFVSARQHGWHRLGTVLPAEFDAAGAMSHAKLGGWHVRKEPLQTVPIISADGVTTLDVPDQFATVRTNPVTGRPDVLGVVGRGYTPIQNEEHADLLDALVDESRQRNVTPHRGDPHKGPARISRPPDRFGAAGRCS